MKQVLIKGGQAVVSTVPAPVVTPKCILVRVEHSCISVGTEMASVRLSGMPLYQRALKQPANVKRVLDMARDQGVKRTMERVSGKLAAGTPTGYSASGVVVEIGEEVDGFSVGDRVACAGAGIANHAEYVCVPVNLAARVPRSLDSKYASTVTLGAIAMQGIRRANPTLGETIVVVGLGVLGQLTAQMLSANGCRVIGVDLSSERVAAAIGNGLDVGIDPASGDYVDRVRKHTDGLGADAVIITAATESHQVISDAMQACRKKGRVVLVGDVGLNLNRADFYKDELDFLISTSYGPGRYDPNYEEGGQDYPLAYVRWTENRNMQAYLALLEQERVRLDKLDHQTFDVEQAADAYASLSGGSNPPLLSFLSYSKPETDAARRKIVLTQPVSETNKIRVGIVGASSFVQGMHLPNLVKLRKDYSLHAVMTRTGSNANAVAQQYQASYCTTDFDEILKDEAVDLVMITTRHDLHGDMVKSALGAGKNVFVEKPLTLDERDIEEIGAIIEGSERTPLLMVGYNRRFSPAVQKIQSVMQGRTTPAIINYRMNAGYIDPSHWVHQPEGGGRNLGEACHIYDLFGALCGDPAEAGVSATSISPSSRNWGKSDNFSATVKYADGSVCTLNYTALGDKSFPKERMDIFVDGKVIVMDDYKSMQVYGGGKQSWKSAMAEKGQLQEMEALADSLLRGAPWPISLESQLQTSRISFEVERQIRNVVAPGDSGSQN
jgi:predicted dehydrogenase/threonine dehydrogenase-like Zn-dependent dehydrogenase